MTKLVIQELITIYYLSIVPMYLRYSILVSYLVPGPDPPVLKPPRISELTFGLALLRKKNKYITNLREYFLSWCGVIYFKLICAAVA